jgi:hypothetical protein
VAERKAVKLVIALLVLDFVLGIALAYKAVQGRPILVVPGVKKDEIVAPDEPSHETVSNFALLAVNCFENFTYHTAGAQRKWLLAHVSPRFATELDAATFDREAVARDSKMSSQLAVDPASVRVSRASKDLFEVEFQGIKQVFIADRMSWTEPFSYRVAVSAGAPTRWNPYGLFLSGMVARKVEKGEGREARPVRDGVNK